jgi:NAD(P)H-hydrate repair Nnr-like enzyme with NAD(P)H-hydrate dehydratase domain
MTAAAWGIWLHNAAGRELENQMGIGFMARELNEHVAHIMRSRSAPVAK